MVRPSSQPPRRMRIRRPNTVLDGLLIGLLVGILGCASMIIPLPGGFGLPQAVAAPAPVSESTFAIAGAPESDRSPVRLDLTLLTADRNVPKPTIVLAHGFGGSKNDSLPLGRSLARQGYTVIAYTARGFGASGGLIHLDDPAYEGADAVKIIDFAARRPEVRTVGSDPVIGFAGASYGGALALLAAALDRRVDAVVPAFTWNNLGQALFPRYDVDRPGTTPADVDPARSGGKRAGGVFKERWASLFFLSGLGGQRAGADQRSGSGTCGRFAAEICRAYQQAASSGRPSSALLALLDRSGAAGRLGTVRAPTLIIQGENDTLFPLDQADATARQLPPDTPKAMIWSEGGHDGGIDLDELRPDLTAWFDRYLGAKEPGANDPGANDSGSSDPGSQAAVPAGFRYAVPQNSLLGRGGGDDDDGGRAAQQVSLGAYPGLPGPAGTETVPMATETLALQGDEQSVLSPPGGSPAALTNLPGTGSALTAAASLGGYALGVLPGQSATFTGAALSQPTTLVGSGQAELQITSTTSEATLFVSLWDLGPDRNGRPSTAVLPGLAVAPVRLTGLTPGRAETVRVALPPVVHQAPIGHRLQLVVSSTDQAYANPRAAAAYRIGLVDSAVTVPKLTGQATAAPLRVSGWLIIAVAVLVFAAALGLLVVWLRRRSVQPRADLAETPLQVEDLAKTYRAGRGTTVRAVDGVSFAAEPGQVVGLLGPNGAGKTTVLRMLVGLIRPDSGAIWVRGQAVHAGADVLGSVGAFIEGPGFLPHLTGRQNLTGYWAATGRPPAEAELDEALRIADLGGAINRPVRGYSQGMRQRLGIAQAMLGLPDLLLLDEPTNGLDPPQIKAMRTVLHDYAAAGRTVVVSSHLLAEVQRTCSHVVMMNRGRVVLTGTVAELTATDHVTVVTVGAGQGARAREVLGQAGWQVDHADGDDGTDGGDGTDSGSAGSDHDRLRVVGDGSRAAVASTLVGAGLDVEALDGRRQLEEVFMSLVGQGSADD